MFCFYDYYKRERHRVDLALCAERVVMKRRKTACVAALCATVLMTGCGSAIPDMTEEETQIVAEYAANLLLKYDKNYEVKVVDTTAYHKEEERKAEEARKAAEKAAKEAEEAKKAEEAAKAESTGNGNKEAADQKQVSSIEEFYQLQGVQIQYSGCGVYDSYPEQTGEEDLFFALGATDGRKLLVMFFDVTNVSGQEMEFNMVDMSPKFKVSINGETAQSTLFTFLPDDLASYKGTLAADETVKTVIVTEVPTEESGSIDSLALTLKNGTDKAQLVLQ